MVQAQEFVRTAENIGAKQAPKSPLFVDFRDYDDLSAFLYDFSSQLQGLGDFYKYGLVTVDDVRGRGLTALPEKQINSALYIQLTTELSLGKVLDTIDGAKFADSALREVGPAANDPGVTAFAALQNVPLVKKEIMAACVHFLSQESTTLNFFEDQTQLELAFGAVEVISISDVPLDDLLNQLGMQGLIREKDLATEELRAALGGLDRFSMETNIGDRLSFKNEGPGSDRYERNELPINVWNNAIRRLHTLLSN